MPRVVPSQVIELIKAAFPNRPEKFAVSSRDISSLSAIVRMVSEIPEELLTISGRDYGDFILSLESLKSTIAQLERTAGTGGTEKPPRVGGKTPIDALLDLLGKCPDTSPSPTTAELSFIADLDLRSSIRNDVSAAYNSLHNAEWKAATVLAGSAIEALLLWAIDQSGKTTTLPQSKKSLDEWTLGEFISGAAQLNLIKPDTMAAAKLTQDFRNLIHPGRVKRLATACSRGTAHLALGAIDLVVRDVTP